MVSKEVESRLDRNPVSFSVSSLPPIHGTVESVSNPLPGPSAMRSVESLQAGVPVGGNRGQEWPGGELGCAQPPLDPPSLGRRSRPPKDVAWRTKRSRPVVGGDLDPLCWGSPSGRDQGWDRCVSDGRHARPSTQGEGRAVSQGILHVDLGKPSQPEGGSFTGRASIPPSVHTAYRSSRFGHSLLTCLLPPGSDPVRYPASSSGAIWIWDGVI